MTESSVLELLLKNQIPKYQIQRQHLSKLCLHCVKCLSKNITDVLYDSLRSKSGLQETEHANVLILLRKWFTIGGKHFPIANDNYGCFINAALGASNVDITDRQEDFPLELGSEHLSELSITKTVIQHYRRLEVINSNKEKLLEHVMMRDRKKCGSINFSLNISKNTEVSSSICMLELINQQRFCLGLLVDEQLSSVKSPDRNREKQIACANALLNLNKTEEDISLLSKILKNLQRYEALEPSEMEFICYLWRDWEQLDLSMEIATLLMETFSFVYEKDFIRMCRDALRKYPGAEAAALTESVGRILAISSKNELLRCKIQSLLYELYACSGYDDRLCNVLTLVS